MNSKDNKLKHLDWAIKSRSANQMCSLRLLTLFYHFEEHWKTKKFSRAAQDLTAVSFSLRRAAFLADKTGKRGIVFEQGKAFLELLIEDNAISYPQDKKSREWTFNYYTRNARSSLEILHKFWPDAVPAYDGKKRNAIVRWEYCQQLLNEAVTGFEKLFHDRKLHEDQVKCAETVRVERKKRRAKVRELNTAQKRQGKN